MADAKRHAAPEIAPTAPANGIKQKWRTKKRRKLEIGRLAYDNEIN
jgi:hypothetical protein